MTAMRTLSRIATSPGLRPALTLIALAAILGACGTSGGAAGSAPPAASAPGAGAATGDVCQWLTNDEIQNATGVTVTGTSHSTLSPAKYCEWALEDGKNVEGVAFKRLVAITVYAGKSSYDVMAAGGSPVPGIGDAAAMVDGQVTVLKGTTHYAVVVVLQQPGDDDATVGAKESNASQTLAAAAAGRIP
jgi:hypothetical protein